MADVDGKRIYELTDEQVSYDKDIVVAVDDATFTSGTKKMAIGDIYSMVDQLVAAGDFNPTTSLLRLNVSAGTEKKVTVEGFLQDTDVVDIIKLLGNTGWKIYPTDITINSSTIVTGTFVCSAISVLGMVTITGKFDTTSQPATDETLWTLPSTIPTSSKNIYFGAVDSQAGVADENYELYLPAGTRTIKNHIAGSSGYEAVYCVTFPAI